MDLSDGLSSDLTRLCAASRVGARVEAARLPLPSETYRPRRKQGQSANVESTSELLDAALNGGEDYELLFTVPPGLTARVPPSFKGTPLTRIGQITPSRHLILHSSDGDKPLTPGGWDPFRPRA